MGMRRKGLEDLNVYRWRSNNMLQRSVRTLMCSGGCDAREGQALALRAAPGPCSSRVPALDLFVIRRSQTTHLGHPAHPGHPASDVIDIKVLTDLLCLLRLRSIDIKVFQTFASSSCSSCSSWPSCFRQLNARGDSPSPYGRHPGPCSAGAPAPAYAGAGAPELR